MARRRLLRVTQATPEDLNANAEFIRQANDYIEARAALPVNHDRRKVHAGESSQQLD